MKYRNVKKLFILPTIACSVQVLGLVSTSKEVNASCFRGLRNCIVRLFSPGSSNSETSNIPTTDVSFIRLRDSVIDIEGNNGRVHRFRFTDNGSSRETYNGNGNLILKASTLGGKSSITAYNPNSTIKINFNNGEIINKSN